MKIVVLFFLFCTAVFSAQRVIPFDTLQLNDAQQLFADDYGSIYLYKNKNFSFSKYDSLGNQLGELRLTLPFKIQDIQNPLNVVLFSQNAQELKLTDQYLVEIQKIDLNRFGFIKMAFVEDQQQIWLLDESKKKLLQYRFRKDEILQSYPVDFEVADIKDLLVYDNRVHILTENSFAIYSLRNSEKIFTMEINAERIRRENENIILIGKNKITEITQDLKTSIIFSRPEAKIVDKNNSTFFEVNANKIYLYPIDKEKLIFQK